MLSALVKSVQHLQDNLLYPTRENEQTIFCFCFTGQFYDSDKESRKSSGIQETLSKQPTGKMRS